MPKKSSPTPSWMELIESRLSALEAGLLAERQQRQWEGALDDEEMEHHKERLDRLEPELVSFIGRLKWLEGRIPKQGRPRSRRRAKTDR